MARLFRVCALLPLSAVGPLACEGDCEEPPGTFEPVEGCEVHLYAGEDVFAFCVAGAHSECGDAESTEAHSWMVTLQSAPMSSRPTPIRVGCGPVDPALLPHAGAASEGDDCCWLMVFEEEEGEPSCVQTNF